MANKPWLEALGISQDTYSIWQKQLPKSESLLLWCLVNQKISTEKYFKWAVEFYGLAKISSDFFKQKPNLELWNKIQSVANWSKDFVPILEWDGVIFIACLEPRTDVNWSFTVQYVLADAQDLEKYWSALHSSADTSAKPNENTSAATTKSELPAAEIAAPEGLSLHLKAGPSLEAPAGLAINTPEGLTMPVAPEGFMQTSAPEGITAVSMPEGLAVSVSAPAGLTVNAPEGLTSSVIQFKQNIEIDSPPPQTSGVENYSEFLHHIQNDFLGGMVLSIKNEQFKALVWDTKFKPASEKAKSNWSLSNPSAFRVAYRTKLPYLGHVVDTPINKDFFANWGYESLPKQVLIHPLKINNEVQYFLLLLTDSQKKNHTLLAAAEKLGQEWAQQIGKMHAA